MNYALGDADPREDKGLRNHIIVYILITIALFIIMYFWGGDFCKNVIYLVTIILGTTIFHFILARPFQLLRKDGFKSETTIEHLILFGISYAIWIFIETWFFGADIANNLFMLNIIYTCAIVTPIISIISSSYLDRENAFPIHILGYLIALQIASLLLNYLNAYVIILIFILLIIMILIFVKEGQID